MGQWFLERKPTPSKEHLLHGSTQPSRPHPDSLRRTPPGSQCRAAPSRSHWAQGNWGWANWWIATPTWEDAPGRANAGDKLMTLVASALAGGDCIDDADALRAGDRERVLGCTVKAPSTLGTFLRSFR